MSVYHPTKQTVKSTFKVPVTELLSGSPSEIAPVKFSWFGKEINLSIIAFTNMNFILESENKLFESTRISASIFVNDIKKEAEFIKIPEFVARYEMQDLITYNDIDKNIFVEHEYFVLKFKVDLDEFLADALT